MTSCFRRIGITFALIGFAAIVPATGGTGGPAYDTQWGSLGSGNGRFDQRNSPLGTVFDYLIVAESSCGEGPLEFASSGARIPNISPCPTPL